MNLMQDEDLKEDKIKKLRNSLILVTILASVLIIAAIVIFVYSQKVSKQQFKVILDGTYNSKLSTTESSVFSIENGKVYTSIKGIAPHIGYTIYNGEYKQYSEDTTSCYASNSKEIVTFSSGADNLKKYPLLGQGEAQSFSIDEKIMARGNNLFISQAGLQRAFNITITYNQNENTVTINTLPYLVTLYEKAITNASLSKNDLGDRILFNNQKALLSNLIVVLDENTKLYGVASYSNNTTSMVITERYKSVEFVEGIDDFIVQTEDRKYGIIGKDGITKVRPAYDQIQELDKDLGLYLVTSNNKQGVINQNGKIIVYQDYDQIGLDDVNDSNVTNKYLLYKNCIPVCANKKWGLIDKNGNSILPVEYDGIGCKLNTNQINTTGTVLIPELEGIVVEKDSKVGNTMVKKYGVVSSTGDKIVNIVADSAYSTTIENKTTYYLTVENRSIDIVSFWYEQKDRVQQTNNQENTETEQDEEDQEQEDYEEEE